MNSGLSAVSSTLGLTCARTHNSFHRHRFFIRVVFAISRIRLSSMVNNKPMRPRSRILSNTENTTFALINFLRLRRVALILTAYVDGQLYIQRFHWILLILGLSDATPFTLRQRINSLRDLLRWKLVVR